MYEEQRKRVTERFNLEDVLLLVSMQDREISLHRQTNTKSLWCVAAWRNGASAGPVESHSQFGWSSTSSQGVIYGAFPLNATSITVEPSDSIYVEGNLFLALVPFGEAITVTFRDINNRSVATNNIGAWNPPVPSRITLSRFSRFKLWLKDYLLGPVGPELVYSSREDKTRKKITDK